MNKNNPITTPVLFMVFNRPEKTQQVFDSIRKVRPTKLYVAVDAPREGRQDDVENSNKVKAIVHNVNWPCEVHYLEHEKNLGCSKAGITAWNWLFEHEDRMIFIEDDGLGNESAFYFVQEMLERYKDDEHIAYVGGVNYGPKFGDASYFFSRQPSATYFMGTWKRVFEKYEYDIESFPSVRWTRKFMSHFNCIGEYIIECRGFVKYINSIKSGQRFNTYDRQMIYLSYRYDYYSIYPNVNMVSNIGLDGGANNHVDVNDPFYKEYGNRARLELDSIIHPKCVSVNKQFELSFYRKRNLYGVSILHATIRALQPQWLFKMRHLLNRRRK